MMASCHGSDSPQYLVFQPLLDGLSVRQRDKCLQDFLVADLRSAFVLIAKLQKTITELQLRAVWAACCTSWCCAGIRLCRPPLLQTVSLDGPIMQRVFVLQTRLVARLLRSSMRSMSPSWRGLRRTPLVHSRHRLDDELSVASASSARGQHQHAHGRKRGQRPARRPPDRHSSGSEASNEERRGAVGFNKDFPYINAKAACIKCGDGWMPGYWHRRARMHVPGMLRHFDPLADKIMCDHCRNKYPLGLHDFPDYKAYVMEAEVERARLES